MDKVLFWLCAMNGAKTNQEDKMEFKKNQNKTENYAKPGVNSK